MIIIIVNKKRTCQIVEFAVPADHRETLEESEKRDKYPDLGRELKENKQRNIKLTVIPVVVNALWTILKEIHTGFNDMEIKEPGDRWDGKVHNSESSFFF